MSKKGAQIILLDKERMQAMVDKDVTKLKNLLCKNLIYTHSSARLDTKDSLIAAMESGATQYTYIEATGVEAQDLGDAVILTGAAQISILANGTPNSFGVRFTDVYQNQGGTWRLVAWQSTKLPA
jgi:hypothetical protein